MDHRDRKIDLRARLKSQIRKVTFKPGKGLNCDVSNRITYNRRNSTSTSSDYGPRSLLPNHNKTRKISTSNAQDISYGVRKDYHSDEIKRPQRTVRDTLSLRLRHDVSRNSELSETLRQHTNRYNSTHNERQSETPTVYRLPARMSYHQDVSSARDHSVIHKSASTSYRSDQPRSNPGHEDDLTHNRARRFSKREVEADCLLEGTIRKRPRAPDDFKLCSGKRRLSTDEESSSSIKKQKIESITTRPMGYKRLEEISLESDPDKVVMQLTAESERFTSLIQSDEIRLDLVRILIRTLSKVQASNINVSSTKFLSSAWQKNGGFLIGHLSPFISAIPENLARFDDVSELLRQISDVLSAMLSRFDKMVVHHISPVILQLKETFEKLQNHGSMQGKEIGVQIEELLSLKEAVAKNLGKGDGAKSTETPPDDFRTLEIMPQSGDFHCYKKPFLRANIVDGAYTDLNHYLDVQFRLLREDFIIPLRDCVKDIVNSTIHPREFEVAEDEHSKKQKSKMIKKTNYPQTYREVIVLNPVCSQKKMVYRIRFDAQHRSIRNIKWNRASKRLKYGSLVCLSSDNFETLHVATVENRDADGLQVGELEVRFEYDNARDVNRYIREKEKFDMVESPTFFEAYRHVLKALQKLDDESLPFQQYIVHCDKDVKAPAYLTQGYEDGNIPVYDLREISSSTFMGAKFAMGQQSIMESSNNRSLKTVPVLSLNEWPCAQAFDLNESQLRALQLALTKEFAVIQGPPGTGKTYVGLKIARALLHNRKVWQGKSRSPILMVSYTNHALDQFVEGLLDVRDVVRVGGRSQNKRVQQFSLKNIRMQKRQQGNISQTLVTASRARTNLMRQLRDLKRSNGLEKAVQLLGISRRCIFSLKLLSKFIDRRHGFFFKHSRTKSGDEMLLQWLKIEKVQECDQKKLPKRKLESEDFKRQFSVRCFADDEYEWDEDEEDGVKTACTLDEAKDSYRLKCLLVKPETADRVLEEKISRIGSCLSRERWMLYRLWRQRLENHYRKILQDSQGEYERILAELQEVQQKEDEYILSQSKVIAMTTTCAARYSSIFQRISPKIIITEEAAEVLEAHVITALNPGCQHLILIGDHEQLRPNPNVFDLAKRFKLDVSLFERMVRVGLDCVRLSVQHRMRPEISALLRHIYTDLQDHETVTHYEDVIGVKKNMFFLNHQEPEQENEDSHSYYNKHEAQVLVYFCRYLLQQGYSSSRITMLTTYTGQMFVIRDCVRSLQDEQVDSVRLTTVDNFQGEENDIVLLSLVRSNLLDKPGFIKVRNRACVAISRAKIGFYCVGNFNLLSKHSEVWSKIVKDLERNELIGEWLPLVCPRHDDNVTEVKCSEDFKQKAEFGGCQKPCLTRLPCGHVCTKTCHSDDRNHQQFKCLKECTKVIKGCLYNHPCPEKCFMPCPEKCIVLVEKTLPCHHVQEVKCCLDKNHVKCKSQCEKTLACGHRCQNSCGSSCTIKCKELVKRTDWTCGHEVTTTCSATQEDCKVPCNATLECGHVCSGKCGECRQGRVHMPCKGQCNRTLVCSHVCKERCAGACPPCKRNCENSCFHSKCDKKCGEECVPCKEKCSWKCKHLSCDKLCNDLCEREPCNQPCDQILSCKHRCRGLCAEECVCVHCDTNGNDEPITSIFLGGEDEQDARFIRLKDCKHIFAVSDMDRYMKLDDEDAQIQLKDCPRCKTPIRHSFRYGNIIKSTLMKISKVKEKLRGNEEECKSLQELLARKVALLQECYSYSSCQIEVHKYWEFFKRIVPRATSISALSMLENQVMLTQACCELAQRLKAEVLGKEFSDPEIKIRNDCLFILSELEYLVKRTKTATEREVKDINTEISRLSLFFELCRLQEDVKRDKVQLQDCHQKILSNIRNMIENRKLIVSEHLEKFREQLAVVRRGYPSLTPITPEVKREIVKAMKLRKGHWFACPKGHIYAIGECGGAMERGRCPECNAEIGGENHRLLQENRLAPEMDGAEFAAWSEQANMANYVLG